jgi:hypothetical protein
MMLMVIVKIYGSKFILVKKSQHIWFSLDVWVTELPYVLADDGLNFRESKQALKNQNNKGGGTPKRYKQNVLSFFRLYIPSCTKL